MGGSASPYKINVNGLSTLESNDIDVEANDSIYVFVQVNIDTSATNNPFISRDSILINYNGNNRYVQLQAYGQNATYYKNKKITGNIVWTNQRPYVILGALTIDTTATLTINAGVKIYAHADAPFVVHGTLKITGTKVSPVIFAGDRLDADYKDLPAGWPGMIFLNTSKDNALTFAIIKNAYQAIVVQNGSVNSNPKLTLSQCIITNSYDAGIFGINTSIQANNCLISNCGNNLLLTLGGNYNFTNCTVAGYSNFYINHLNPVLQLSNAAMQGGQTLISSLSANFKNSIFWGEGGPVEDEVIVQKAGNTSFNVTFDNCLYKALHDPMNTTLNTVYKNVDPQFDSINSNKQIYDFHFNNHPSSPAVDKGTATIFPFDLDNRIRANNATDLGCYER